MAISITISVAYIFIIINLIYYSDTIDYDNDDEERNICAWLV